MSIDPPIAPWTLVDTRAVIRNRWLTLQAQTCRTPEGIEISPYYVLDFPDWVQVVAIDGQDRLLLVEQYRQGLGVVSLELPGGGVDPADPDVLSAARRELREETGCVADHWELVASLAPNPANQTNYCHAVLARGARIAGPPRDDPAERIRSLWLPVDEAAQRALAGEMVQAIHVAALALVLGRMGRWGGATP